VVKPDGNSSGLQEIKANPSKPSVDAMLTLLDKLKVIEATGVLGVDLLWLNGKRHTIHTYSFGVSLLDYRDD